MDGCKEGRLEGRLEGRIDGRMEVRPRSQPSEARMRSREGVKWLRAVVKKSLPGRRTTFAIMLISLITAMLI